MVRKISSHLSGERNRYKTIHGTKLHDEIVSGGTDGAASMTG